jgi:hypothetical protein
VKSDFGILANYANSFSSRFRVLWAVGATGIAARAALSFLANPGGHPTFQRILSTEGNVCVVFQVFTSDFRIRIIAVED